MFGGYSIQHGQLNDIRQFDIRNNTWVQVTIESTPDAKIPKGRYYHAAEIIHTKQIIFVHGGLTRINSKIIILDDCWQFSLQTGTILSILSIKILSKNMNIIQ